MTLPMLLLENRRPLRKAICQECGCVLLTNAPRPVCPRCAGLREGRQSVLTIETRCELLEVRQPMLTLATWGKVLERRA